MHKIDRGKNKYQVEQFAIVIIKKLLAACIFIFWYRQAAANTFLQKSA